MNSWRQLARKWQNNIQWARRGRRGPLWWWGVSTQRVWLRMQIRHSLMGGCVRASEREWVYVWERNFRLLCAAGAHRASRMARTTPGRHHLSHHPARLTGVLCASCHYYWWHCQRQMVFVSQAQARLIMIPRERRVQQWEPPPRSIL